MTKFDQIASFWEDFVMEPEEKEQREQQMKRRAKAKAAAPYCWWTGCHSVISLEDVEGKAALAAFLLHQKQSSSQDDSSLSSLRLQPELQIQLSGSTTDASSGRKRSDRRCDSVGDRGMHGGMGMRRGAFRAMISKPPKPDAKPIEINVDLERIVAPVEDAVAQAIIV